jgi:YegS/Rv2252/BmrU family lipid kinase
MTRGFLVVANAGAGTAESEHVDAAVRALSAEGAAAQLVMTDSLEHLAATLADLDGRTLVVAGGDGSMHAAVGALHRSGALGDTTVGLVPLGTGNDLATGLGLPDEPAAAAAVCLHGSAQQLDLIVTDRDEVVVNASHAGLGAVAAGESERFKDRLGAVAYPLGALIAAVRESGWNLKVTLDDEVVHDGQTLMVGVANAPSIGGGTRLIPPAVPDDGELDVIVVSAVTAAARVAFGVALRDGVHLDREDVVHLRGRQVVIAGDPVAHDLDGEITDERAACAYRVMPAAWQMLLPPAGGGARSRGI